MDDRKENRLIRRLDIANTLSFGNTFAGIELRNLNVLIGPNGSGKSNLIEVINFLRAAPRDFQEALRNGVGATNWQWKTDGYVMGPSQVVAEFDHSDSLLTHLVAGNGNRSYTFNTEKITCTVQLFFTEEKCGSIPASSLSDRTLRYLSLLTILCDPSPPGLICIEVPELGLHPDVIPALGDLLREAATRSQIIVTTHSDVLVDAMSETPESVVVCSKENGQSVMQRLDTADLHIWLEKYRLGQLWTEGKIGGNRW
jgi:predicted ATPase